MPLGIFSPTVNSPQVSGASQITQYIGSTTVVGFQVPTSAVGFLLQADSNNAANVRWRIGSAASATLGHQLEGGRDTGVVPVYVGTTLSVIPESAATLSIQLTWFIGS